MQEPSMVEPSVGRNGWRRRGGNLVHGIFSFSLPRTLRSSLSRQVCVQLLPRLLSELRATYVGGYGGSSMKGVAVPQLLAILQVGLWSKKDVRWVKNGTGAIS